jgi:TcpE family
MALQLPTYTSLWRLERRLYAIDDIPLGRGVPYDKLGIYAGIILPWWILLNRLGIRFERGLPSILYLVVPGIAAYFAARDVAEGKRPLTWAWSQVRYLFEPRAWHRLTPAGRRMPQRIHVVVSCWRPAAAVLAAGPPRRRAVPPPPATPPAAARALLAAPSGLSALPEPSVPPPQPARPARDLVLARSAANGLPSLLEQQRMRRAAARARRRRVLSFLTLGLIRPPDRRRGAGSHTRQRAHHPRRTAQ